MLLVGSRARTIGIIYIDGGKVVYQHGSRELFLIYVLSTATIYASIIGEQCRVERELVFRVVPARLRSASHFSSRNYTDKQQLLPWTIGY
jgi:hypothetical protein